MLKLPERKEKKEIDIGDVVEYIPTKDEENLSQLPAAKVAGLFRADLRLMSVHSTS